MSEVSGSRGNRLRFSREHDDGLIEAVSKNPCLYDVKHKDFHDRALRKSIWAHIAQEINKSVADCKIRWKSLKGVYQKRKKEMSDGSTKRHCKWEHMDSLKFLEGVTSSKRAKAWLEACGRLDLSEKVAKLHKSHRICGIHFSAPMFLKGKRKLLRKNAVPKRYVTSLPYDISIPSTSYTSSSEQVDQPEITRFPLTYASCQTVAHLSQNTPRKQGLKRKITELQNSLKPCKRRLVTSISDVLEFLEHHYPQESTMLIRNQLLLLDQAPKGSSTPAAPKPKKVEPSDQPDLVNIQMLRDANEEEETEVEESEIKIEMDEMDVEEAALLSIDKEESDREMNGAATSSTSSHVEEPDQESSAAARHPLQIFFDSMARTAMSFPPPLAVRAKTGVLEVISKLELEMWNQSE